MSWISLTSHFVEKGISFKTISFIITSYQDTFEVERAYVKPWYLTFPLTSRKNCLVKRDNSSSGCRASHKNCGRFIGATTKTEGFVLKMTSFCLQSSFLTCFCMRKSIMWTASGAKYVWGLSTFGLIRVIPLLNEIMFYIKGKFKMRCPLLNLWIGVIKPPNSNPEYKVPSREAMESIFIVFGLTPLGIKPTTHHSQGQQCTTRPQNW